MAHFEEVCLLENDHGAGAGSEGVDLSRGAPLLPDGYVVGMVRQHEYPHNVASDFRCARDA